MTTFIINHAPYGTEKPYNALRMVLALIRKKESVRIFLMDDGIFNAIKNQKNPNSHYNIEQLLTSLIECGCDVHT